MKKIRLNSKARDKVSRRNFLSGVACTGAAMLIGDPKSSEAADDFRNAAVASRVASTPPPIMIANPGYHLLIDSKKGSIVSFRSTFGVDRELLVPNHGDLPMLQIEFLDERSGFHAATSSQAKDVKAVKGGNEKEQTVTIDYHEIGGLPVDAHVTIRCPAEETLTYWSLEVTNNTESWIGHIQFPVLQVPYDGSGEYSSHILSSFADGVLSGPVQPSAAIGAWGGKAWNHPEVWRRSNYPGQWVSTQLMAYYNDLGGLYLACDDATGLPKFISPLLDDGGVTMGLGHYPGTHGPATARLPYNVVLGSFHGDWYTAAGIYREWSSKQPFTGMKLSERKDCPKWIRDPVVSVAFPMRGEGDWDSPVVVNPEYTPATNAIPFLEKLAEGFDSSLIPIVFNWEHGGPWVQPDAFPPLGGDGAMREFMAKAKEKGWYPMIYGDGLTWTLEQRNTKYDGWPYFHAHDGEQAVIRDSEGNIPQYDSGWGATNTFVCVGAAKGREMVLGMTRGMAEFGPAVIQQFDQGPGPIACFAKDHGHPPVPGPWMTEAFQKLLEADSQVARAHNPDVAMSCEGAPPEVYLQNFQIWDARTSTCPLYSFLYHEYGNGFSGFYTNRVDGEALYLSVARALVTGYIVNLTLRDKGQIEYDWDQLWGRAVPDQKTLLDWTKRGAHFRAGVARDYLAYGRMLKPWRVSNVSERDFGRGKESVVQSATWQAPDGRIGVVLANCSVLGESPRLELQGEGARKLTLYLDGEQVERSVDLPSILDLEMGSLSYCLVEVG